MSELVHNDDREEGDDVQRRSPDRRDSLAALLKQDPRHEQQKGRMHVEVDPGDASEAPNPPHRSGASVVTAALSQAVPARRFRKYKLSEPNLSDDLSCTSVRVLSSVNQISARPPSPKMPDVLITGLTTIVLN